MGLWRVNRVSYTQWPFPFQRCQMQVFKLMPCSLLRWFRSSVVPQRNRIQMGRHYSLAESIITIAIILLQSPGFSLSIFPETAEKDNVPDFDVTLDVVLVIIGKSFDIAVLARANQDERSHAWCCDAGLCLFCSYINICLANAILERRSLWSYSDAFFLLPSH